MVLLPEFHEQGDKNQTMGFIASDKEIESDLTNDGVKGTYVVPKNSPHIFISVWEDSVFGVWVQNKQKKKSSLIHVAF